jgi:hypothetical protein
MTGSVPGFTAEASLYRTSGRYGMSWLRARSVSVVSAQATFNDWACGKCDACDRCIEAGGPSALCARLCSWCNYCRY